MTALGAVLLLAPAAQAAFPGANGRIAFVLSGDSGDEIFSVNPDGSGMMPLTGEPEASYDPAWSADGARIAFTREGQGAGQTQVWVMNADGSGETQLTTGDGDCDPYFLPDGRIVFVRSTSFCPAGGDIYIRNLDGTETNLAESGEFEAFFTPTASPDGQTIAFASGRDLRVSESVIATVPVTGGAPTAVTADHGTLEIIDTAPNYSPDGTTIVFDRCLRGEGCIGQLILATVPAGGGAVTHLANDAESADACQPAYAPDGTRIVFTLLFLMPTSCRPAAAEFVGLAFIGPTGGAFDPFVEGGFAPDWQPVVTRSPAAPTAPSTAATGTGAPPGGECFGRKVTIRGTNEPEKIVGTSEDDVIKGKKGGDKIYGKGGDDVICGQRGRDKLFGNNGEDILIGGAAVDFLDGGTGVDRLFGGTPNGPDRNKKNVCVGNGDDELRNCAVVK